MTLSENLVLMKTKLSSLDEVRSLNLWGAELSDISLCRKLPNLEVLALSVNHVTSLVDVTGCKKLRELYLRKNDVAGIRQATHLRHLPKLTTLWLTDNPIMREDNYRLYCIKYAPGLTLLDTVEVTPEERAAANSLPELRHLPAEDAATQNAATSSSSSVAPPPMPPRVASGTAASEGVARPQSSSASGSATAPQHGRRADIVVEGGLAPAPIAPTSRPHSGAVASSSPQPLPAAPAPARPIHSDDSQRTILTAIVTLLGELSPASMLMLQQEINARVAQQRR